jgi:hypothetical protein
VTNDETPLTKQVGVMPQGDDTTHRESTHRVSQIERICELHRPESLLVQVSLHSKLPWWRQRFQPAELLRFPLTRKLEETRAETVGIRRLGICSAESEIEGIWLLLWSSHGEFDLPRAHGDSVKAKLGAHSCWTMGCENNGKRKGRNWG